MSALSLSDVLKDLRDLPALPAIVLELINTFNQQDVDVATLADKISREQALAAKTLRLANSSFYGLPSKVSTINQAIVVLGFDSVRALVSANGIIDSFAGADAQIDVARFWRHSIATAICARSLAGAVKLNQDYAFISGLLHDIGKLVLATRFPQEFAEMQGWCAAQDAEEIDAERQVLGVDHQRVGVMLAHTWKFPMLIQRAIGNHHKPMPEDMGDLACVVHVANAVVHALDLTGGEFAMVPRIEDAAWDSLKLDDATLASLFRSTELQFEEACQVLAA